MASTYNVFKQQLSKCQPNTSPFDRLQFTMWVQ